MFKATTGDRGGHEHVCRDQITLASRTLWRYAEQKLLCKFSVWIYTEDSITTVLLQYAMLYKNGMKIVIFLFLVLLFLKILYNKRLYILY